MRRLRAMRCLRRQMQTPAHPHPLSPPSDTHTSARPSQKITDKCYTRCVSKPGPRLDKYEMECMAMCMDRYMEAMTVVSQTWAHRMKQQAAQGGMGGGGLQ